MVGYVKCRGEKKMALAIGAKYQKYTNK